MAVATSPATTEHTGQHHRPPKTNFFFFFFPPEGVPVSIKQEQKTAIEIYEGTARVGCPHGQGCHQQEKNPTIDYPRIETSSDTMLRFVAGKKRWRLPPLNIIQTYLT